MGFLGDLMHLPEGHRIVAVRMSDSFMDAIDILVEGPTLPVVRACEVAPRVQFLVTVTEDGTMVRERKFEGKFSS
jgi:hypothetical protein